MIRTKEFSNENPELVWHGGSSVCDTGLPQQSGSSQGASNQSDSAMLMQKVRDLEDRVVALEGQIRLLKSQAPVAQPAPATLGSQTGRCWWQAPPAPPRIPHRRSMQGTRDGHLTCKVYTRLRFQWQVNNAPTGGPMHFHNLSSRFAVATVFLFSTASWLCAASGGKFVTGEDWCRTTSGWARSITPA